jgi:hypothetical protein
MSGTPSRLLPGLLVAVVLLAGWRTMASTRQVLGGSDAGKLTPEQQKMMEEDAAEKRVLRRVASDDSLLNALRKAPRLPDPFHPTPPPRPVSDQVKPEPVRLPRPTVVMVIVEPSRQEVILGLGSQESPRLRVGGSWKGWNILRIDRDVVEIENQQHEKAYVPVRR